MLCTTVIPTVNRPSLEQAVKSALEQDLGSGMHEILVFNNSDGPLPDTDWLSSSIIKIVDTHSNLIHASNMGANMASGKYINYLHDDDYLLPGALKTLTEIAETSGNFWITGGYNLVDDDGNFMSTVRPQVKGNILALLVGGECLPFASSLINKEALLKVGGFDLQIPGISDIVLESQIALLSDFNSTQQVVAVIRLAGGEGTTHDWTSRTKQDFRRMREKILNSDGALNRMRVSVQGDEILRGRASRAYLVSAALNVLDGHIGVAASRLVSFVNITSYHFVLPDFWRGLFFRSHWHNVQKSEQEEYFNLNSASEEKNNRGIGT